MNGRRGSRLYVVSEELMQTVNIAAALEKPLLIKEEPGTGETKLAKVVSDTLHKGLIFWDIKSTTKAQEGLHVHNIVQHLYGSQFDSEGADNIEKYIELDKLGEIFTAKRQVVLLTDEIDKADSESPDDLL